MGAISALVPLAYFILGVFQVVATFAGVQHFLDVHWIIAGVISLLLGWFPLIGTAAGVYGAVAVWDWSLPAALGLFFGPLVVMAVIYFTAEAMSRRA